MMFDLTEKVALVTGAGRGVGAGIARALAEQGATIAVNDYFEDRAEAMAAELVGSGASATAVAFDATDKDAVVAGVAKIAEELGAVDILVANVGTLPHGQTVTKFLDMDPAEWQQHVDNNLYSLLNCVHAIAPGMVEKGWGRIVAISSDAGRVGHVGSSVYGAAKAGMIGLMKNLGKELGPDGITANSIALGLINTVPPEFSKGAERHYSVGRIGTPEDVGAACVYLASEEAGWVSGHCMVLNGASHGG
jgi:NAD(P)-dependent dehydrogenase (short-subunit alcohol dehydrogenase family)